MFSLLCITSSHACFGVHVFIIKKKLFWQGIQQLSSQKMEARMSALNHERQTRAKVEFSFLFFIGSQEN
mgnify:CR=1 FL=1